MPTIDQRTRERTRVEARPVANTAQFVDTKNAGAGFGALSKLFGGLSEQERLKKEAALKISDENSIASLSLAVAGRENEVRESIRSGDYSKWGIHQDMGRQTFRRSAMEVFGEALAAGDKVKYQSFLNNLQPGDDPVAATGDWIRAQTNGMDPMGQAKYQEVTEAYAGKLITARQKTLTDLALKQGLDRIPLNIQAGLETNSFSNARDIELWATKFGSSQSLGQNVLKARQLAMDAATKELLRIHFTTTDKAELEKVTSILNSQTSSGISLRRTIDRKSQEAILSESLAAARRPNSVRTEQLHSTITQRLQNIGTLGTKASFGEEPDTLMRVFKDLTSQWGKGDNSEPTNSSYIALRGKVLKAMVADGTANELAKNYLATGQLMPGDANKIQDQLLKMAAEDPENSETYLGQAAKIAMSDGPSNVFRNQLNKSLRGDDVGNAMSAAATVRNMVQNSNLGYQQIIGNDEDVQAYYLALTSSVGGPQAEQKLALVRDTLREDGTWKGAYENSWNLNKKDRATKGKRGKIDFLVDLFEGMKGPEKVSLGFTEGTKFKSLNPKFRRRMGDLLDLAALATTTGDDNTEAQLEANLKILMKNTGQIGWTINEEGKFEQEITLRDSPLLVRNALGKLSRANGWGEAQSLAAEEYFMHPRYEAARVNFQFGGVETDDRTSTHGDYSVTATDAKVPLEWRTFSSAQGVPTELWNATLANVPFIHEVQRRDGVVAFNVLPPGERQFANPDGSTSTIEVPEEFVLDNYLKYVWNTEDKKWMLRYRDGSTKDADGVNSVAGGIAGEKEEIFNVFNQIPEDTKDIIAKKGASEEFKAPNISGKSREEMVQLLENYSAKMNPGNGDAATGDEALSENELRAQRRFTEHMIDEMTDNGIYTGRAALHARDLIRKNQDNAKAALMEIFEGRREIEKLYGSKQDDASLVNMWENEPEDIVREAEEMTRKDQMSKDSLGAPAEDSLMFRISDDLSVSEAYADTTTDGRVGFGFDITRDDADELLAAADAPTKKALENGAHIDRGAATRLVQASLSKTVVSVRKQLEGVPMDEHQWEAIFKYSYGNPVVEKKRDPLHALAFRESSMKRDAVNKFNYLGLWQMGAMALKDGGYVTTSSNTDMKNPAVWTGKDGINSQEDFLKDVKVQEKAVRDLHRRNLFALKKWGVVKLGDDPAHIQGLLFAAHLLGAGSVRKYTSGEGGGLTEDANGTTFEEYYELGRKSERTRAGELPHEIEEAIRANDKNKVAMLMRKLQPIQEDERDEFALQVKGGQRGEYFKGAMHEAI